MWLQLNVNFPSRPFLKFIAIDVCVRFELIVTWWCRSECQVDLALRLFWNVNFCLRFTVVHKRSTSPRRARDAFFQCDLGWLLNCVLSFGLATVLFLLVERPGMTLTAALMFKSRRRPSTFNSPGENSPGDRFFLYEVTDESLVRFEFIRLYYVVWLVNRLESRINILGFVMLILDRWCTIGLSLCTNICSNYYERVWENAVLFDNIDELVFGLHTFFLVFEHQCIVHFLQRI